MRRSHQQESVPSVHSQDLQRQGQLGALHRLQSRQCARLEVVSETETAVSKVDAGAPVTPREGFVKMEGVRDLGSKPAKWRQLKRTQSFPSRENYWGLDRVVIWGKSS